MKIASLAVVAVLVSFSLACNYPQPAASGVKTISFDEFRALIKRSGVWSGGPDGKFELVGRSTLASAIQYGLMPNHKVLDVGAGSLRVGWWLIQYINPSNYYAIEPNRAMIDPIAKGIGAHINVYYNDDWKFPPIKFDFVIARSIWTHASKWMISKMLSEFAENSTPNGKFLTSVHFAQSDDEDYKGDDWVGKSHQSDKPGVIRHSRAWIEEECKKNGLWMEVEDQLSAQTWLLIGRSKAPALDTLDSTELE